MGRGSDYHGLQIRGIWVDPQQKAEEINSLYDSDPIKYRYGKDVLYKLEELISLELNIDERSTLSTVSNIIKISEIETFKQIDNKN